MDKFDFCLIPLFFIFCLNKSKINISKLHCHRALLFHRPKLEPPLKGVCWIKIVNKTSFENGEPPGVNEYRGPPVVISTFYSLQMKLFKNITI